MTDLVITNLQTRVPGMAVSQLLPLSCCLQGGEITGLYGPSGCGKSLLLRAIADLDPAIGDVTLGTEERNSMPAHDWRTKVAYLPTESGWWFDTVGEHFNQIDEQLEQLFEQLGFDSGVLDWKISRISSGEKQRLALARCLQQSPSALLLDEPTASLGDDHTVTVEEIVTKYIIANSAPAFWVSHDLKQLNRIVSVKIEILQDGTISVPVI